MNQSLSVRYIWLKSLGIKSENAVVFQRPVALSSGHVPSPTAGVAQPLAVRKVRLAVTQFFLCLDAFGSVNGSTHIFKESSGLVKNGMGQVFDAPDGPVWP